MRTLTLTFLVFLLLISSVSPTFAQRKKRKKSRKKAKVKRVTVSSYVDTYKAIAIAEMERSNIPASITLAQGILESEHGNSYLAKKAQNHFGIKCHKDWDGARVYARDDKRRDCFRKYDNAYTSYIDHSNFLNNNPRYVDLFDLEGTDYKSWAKGLRKAGYATNKKYAKLLIKLIESYDLQAYDILFDDNMCDEMIAAVPSKYNGIKTVLFGCDVSVERVAEAYQVKLDKLLRYNNLDIGDIIQANTFVFLEKLKRRSPKGISKHKVAEGESMLDIARLYGIKKTSLYRRNRMKYNTEPLAGEWIYLRKRRGETPELCQEEFVFSAKKSETNPPKVTVTNKKKKPKTRSSKKSNSKINVGSFVASIASFFKPTKATAKSTASNYNSSPYKPKVYKSKKPLTKKIAPVPTKVPKAKDIVEKGDIFHVVRSGDTLSKIAKKYGSKVRLIKKVNGLKNHLIYPKQVLVVPFK